MCGIAGVVSRQINSSTTLEDMSKVLRHRGPDDEGYYLKNGDKENYYSGEDTVASLQLPRLNNESFILG